MNFKKLIVAASIVLAGCASSSHKPVAVNSPPPPPAAPVASALPAPPPAPVAPPAAPVDPLLVSGDTWSFRVPDENWEVASKDDLPGEDCVALSQNMTLKARLMLMSDAFPSDTATFNTFVLKGVTSDGGKLIKSAKVTINGTEWAWADTSMALRKGLIVRVQIWNTVHDGNGFTLMCGGPTTSATANPAVVAACKQIAGTLQLK